MIPFGNTYFGSVVHKITIADGNLSVSLLTWGAVVQEVMLKGVPHSLTLGSETLADYETTMCYFGCLIGPVANRISTGRVKLDGMMYELERNQDGRVHLHSGSDGAHHQVWDVIAATHNSATLALDLPDGVNGLPGNRRIVATYTVTAPATLTLEITATTDAKTLFNIANHSYWNLDGTSDYRGHSLRIAAEHYLPTDADNCPTGEIALVSGTGFDFRAAQTLTSETMPIDHNFCLSESATPLRDVLTLTGASGVCMDMATTEPGLQIYDGHGAARPGLPPYEGIAIEAQRWPDAPNHTEFPSFVTTPEQPYRQTTQWRFQRSDGS